jgi:hypothetical protein
VKGEEDEEKIETATRTRSTRCVSWHDSFDLWYTGTKRRTWSASRGTGECQLICMSLRRYLSTLPPYIAVSSQSHIHELVCGLRPVPLNRPALLPMFQFAAQSRSWEGTIVFAGL